MSIKVTALAGMFLIACTFLLGSLSYFIPEKFSKYRAWRRFLGVTGFFIILIHVILSIIFFYNLDLNKMFYNNPKIMALYSGIVAFLILLSMAITSNDNVIKFVEQRWGYLGWKKLQTAGYFALALSILHVYLLETKPDVGFKIRPLGLAIFIFALIVLIARIGVLVGSKLHEHDFK